MMQQFLVACILIELTPGPNMTWLAVLGATRGRGAAIAAVAGIALGLALAGIVAGLGLTVLFDNFPILLTALRYAGTIYILYLAYDAWTDSNTPDAIDTKPPISYFKQGFVSNALNPKAYLFYAAILPQFLTIIDHPHRQIALLTAVYVAVATIIHLTISLAAGNISGWLAHSTMVVRMRQALAIAIAITAFWFFFSTGNLK